MKRSAMEQIFKYDQAAKKVSLVERNKTPNGAKILSLNTISMHEPNDIISLAEQIQRADDSIKNNACGKLSIILEQIKFLQSQAEKILKESQEHSNLHHAACNFKKIPGKVYHMYKRESGQTYFSMLSPEEWGSSLSHEYLGSYRLEHDQSWTAFDKIAETNKTKEWAMKLFNSSKSTNLLAIDKISDMDL